MSAPPGASQGAMATPTTPASEPSAAGDRLTAALASLDASLQYAESDANAEFDIVGNIYANVNVTTLRVSVAEIKGVWAFLQEEALQALLTAEHGMTVSHNLRATDLTVEAFDGFLAAGKAREELEFMTDLGSELRRTRRAVQALGLPAADTTGVHVEGPGRDQ